jgi:hypothetical protein
MISPEELGLEVYKYSGDEATVRCIYHDDVHPSAQFNIRSGLFYCFVCGIGKKAEDIAKELGGVLSDIPMPKGGFVEPEIDWRARFLTQPLAIDSPYLTKRQVPQMAIKKLDIRAFDEGIIFPLFSNQTGDISGVQVRYFDRKPKYIFYGKRPAVYPIPMLPILDGPAILVEGVFSVIRGRSAGFEVFATLGATSLAPALNYFYDRTNVRGVFDADSAGCVAMAKLASVGIACIAFPFEADEQTIGEWKLIIGNKNNFTMDVTHFIIKAINLGVGPKAILKQILKFEKENSNAKIL